MLGIIIGCVILAVFYLWYAGIISKRNKAREALSGIDVQLNQRFDLIPNIMKIANKFMEHEKGLMEEITQLRTKAVASYNPGDTAAVREHISASEQLSAKMGQLMVNVENYPNLKSDQTMVRAMQTYNEVEAQLAASRRFYNSAATALNNSIQIFPGNIIAGIAGAAEMPFFQADESVKANIDADKFLK